MSKLNLNMSISRALLLAGFIFLLMVALRFFTQPMTLKAKLLALGDIENLGGTELNELPYFFHKNVFVGGQKLDIALDPSKYSPIVKNKAQVLVVDHKTPSDWQGNTSSLIDVTGAIELLNFTSGTLDQNVVTAWDPITPSHVEDFPWYEHYDIVLDFDQDFIFTPDTDILDIMGETELDYKEKEGGITIIKDPTEPGGGSVGTEDYIISISPRSLKNPCICDQPSTLTKLGGTIYFPEDQANPGKISTAMGDLPLVLLAYGIGGNRKSFEYLANHLASRGFIAVTIDMPPSPSISGVQGILDIVFRGQIILEHLNRLLDGNNPPTPFIENELQTKVNKERIGLIGHSRAGEGVIAAKNLWKAQSQQSFRITAVCSLAPTDHSIIDGGYTIELPCNKVIASPSTNCDLLNATPPFLMLNAGKDSETRFAQGYRILDKTQRDKYGATILNGTHRGFDEQSSNGANPKQRLLTKAFALSFMNVYLKSEQFYLPVLAGHVDYDLINAEYKSVIYSFHPSGGESVNNLEAVDRFETDPPLETKLGLAITGNNLICMEEEWLGYRTNCDSCIGKNFYSHHTNGLKVTWDTSTPIADIELPIDGKDFTEYSYLNFRIAQRYRSQVCIAGSEKEQCCLGNISDFGCVSHASCAIQDDDGNFEDVDCPEALNQINAMQDLSIVMFDSNNKLSNLVKVSTYYPAGIPYTITGSNLPDQDQTNTIMQTITIPLEGFKANNDILMDDIKIIQLKFDQTSLGEVIIDDIEIVGLNPYSLAR